MQRSVFWAPAKAEANWRKHGIRFDEARTVFFDPLLLSVEDREHSNGEERFIAVAQSLTGALLLVIYTIRDDDAWLISARPATRSERRRYMAGDRIRDEDADEEREEYDFTNAVRGRHTIKPRGPITVEIDAVVAEFFHDEASVNDALRRLIVEGRAPDPRPRD